MPGLDWRQIQREATIVDLHVHPSMQQQIFSRNLSARSTIKRTLLGENPFAVRASFPKMHEGNYDVILSILHIPEKGLRRDFPMVRIFQYLRPHLWKKLILSQPYEATLDIMADMEKAVAKSPAFARAQMACSPAELDAILSQPKGQRPLAVIHAVEGGHSLDGKEGTPQGVMRHVEELHQRGVAYITLAHFYPNQITHPCYPFPEDVARLSKNPNLWRDQTLGLTDLGKQVVARMMEMGMLIDLSHSTPTARAQIYDIADGIGKPIPLLATHVGAYGLNPSPYNLTDWEIRRIARDGGVVGVIFMPYWLMPKNSGQGINFISRHIQYLIQTGGEDIVGIGTDFDGFTTPPDDLDNASLMHRLTERLVVDGYSEPQIKKILGENALRALHAGWKA